MAKDDRYAFFCRLFREYSLEDVKKMLEHETPEPMMNAEHEKFKDDPGYELAGIEIALGELGVKIERVEEQLQQACELLQQVHEDGMGDLADQGKRVWPIRAELHRHISAFLDGRVVDVHGWPLCGERRRVDIDDIDPEIAPECRRDMVYQEEGEWWFWDETWMSKQGPFVCEKATRAACRDHVLGIADE